LAAAAAVDPRLLGGRRPVGRFADRPARRDEAYQGVVNGMVLHAPAPSRSDRPVPAVRTGGTAFQDVTTDVVQHTRPLRRSGRRSSGAMRVNRPLRRSYTPWKAQSRPGTGRRRLEFRSSPRPRPRPAGRCAARRLGREGVSTREQTGMDGLWAYRGVRAFRYSGGGRERLAFRDQPGFQAGLPGGGVGTVLYAGSSGGQYGRTTHHDP
jgi:hypothetical protein